MSGSVERLEAEVLDLPSHQRAHLAKRLLDSLDPEPAEADEVELAWTREITERLDEYHAGTVAVIPASEVFSDARARRE